MTATQLAEEAARIAEAQPPIDVEEVNKELDRIAEIPRQVVSHADVEPWHEPALIPRTDELQVLAQLAVTFAQAGLVPKALQGKPADVLLVLMTGRGLGIDPLVALRECHPIEGKVTVSPKLKLAIVRQRGLGQVWPDPANDAESATWHATRNDDPRVTTYSASYSMDDARTAKLETKDNWKKYPRQMLQWRALGYLLDIAFGEVGTGLYSADELGAMTDDEGHAVIDVGEVAPLAGIEPPAPKPPSTANGVCPDEERAAIKARISALPPPAVQALAERWSKPDPVTGDPTLWPLKVLPNRQVKAAHALVDSVEKQARAGDFGEWVGGAPEAPETPLDGPESAPDPDPGCSVPDCPEPPVTITDDGVAFCGNHAPI